MTPQFSDDMNYNEYRYLYPPRPEYKISASALDAYDNGQYLACPKINGSAAVVFLGDGQVRIMNRHNEVKTRAKGDFVPLQKTRRYFVYCGENLEKARRDEHGNLITGFVIWDILVSDGLYLIGTTFEERMQHLEMLFPSRRMIVKPDGDILQYDHLCFTDIEGIYRVPTYQNNFTELYNDIVKTDLYEGLVLKKGDAKLELGFNEKNNFNWQIKCRKQTKNYLF